MDLFIVELHQTGYAPVLAESAEEARAKAESYPEAISWLGKVEAVSAKMEFDLKGVSANGCVGIL